MLYPKNLENKIDLKLFEQPTAEYRCTPFWAWNCDLKKEELFKEIDAMKEMGMGGFHMHTRVGMSTVYLSDEYMALIKACTEKAKSMNMLAWLYDEDKWPSGFAGGYVTKKKENRQKFLMLTTTPYAEDQETSEHLDASGFAQRSNNGKLMARYAVELDEAGFLKSYRLLKPEEKPESVAKLWYGYLETPGEGPWFNGQTYVDTMSKSAIDEFIQITHERYKEVVGEDFGKSVPAIFTDEPQITRKTCLRFAKQEDDIILPFTTDLEDTYRAEYGESLLEKIPEVIWNKKGVISTTRYRYHDHVTERFAEAFCDNIGKWCSENGILMTGHMMEEVNLQTQSAAVGEVMRNYRSFTLPGVDMLCDARELTTVKQAASAAHQYGREGVMSELYGVTNWDFDFRGHKLQGDWQAALGVSVRVPHLYWVSMKGEAKRDYPASIGHQSAWYQKYSFIEDHFARVNTLMTRGTADINIGVIHPIESYWVNFGPTDQSGGVKSELNDNFMEFAKWMLFANLDYDYISESLLPEQYQPNGDGFQIGQMHYDVVVVPGCVTLRETTVAALEQFVQKGGTVLFVGKAPTHVDALPSDRAAKLAEHRSIDNTKNAIVQALEPFRKIKIVKNDGNMANNILYGLRSDGVCKNLFLCHCNEADRNTIRGEEAYTVTVQGIYKPVVFDTFTGKTYPITAKYEGDTTAFSWHCYEHSSLLLQLEPGKSTAEAAAPAEYQQLGYLKSAVPVTLAEPNVCVLDMTEWCADDGVWHPAEENLRVCIAAKKLLNLDYNACHGAQPWTRPVVQAAHTISLRYHFESLVDVADMQLALENFDETDIFLDGKPVTKQDAGYYVDFSITRVPLGSILAGKHELLLKRPFTEISNVENIFLLGDFGVEVRGASVWLTNPVRSLYFGDWTKQGLPFYGGKITYHCSVAGGQNTAVELGTYAAPCVTVCVDGGTEQNVSLAPYRAELGVLSAGPHTLDITVYASRINTFGALHLCSGTWRWFGPPAWRTEGAEWSYEYRLTPSGLFTAPRVFEKK